MGMNGLEVLRKIGDEVEYSKVPLESLGEVPPVSLHIREERQKDKSITSSPPAGRPGYTSPSARGKQEKRPRSKSKTRSPTSRSPPSKKADERDVTNGLLKKPDIGQVINIQASTPTKQIQKTATHIDNPESPIFRKVSTSA
jgi:hypothetical protein